MRICDLRFAICDLQTLTLAVLFSLAALARPEEKKDDGQDVVFLADSRPVLMRLHVRIDGKPVSEAWESFVNYLFDQADGNKDGKLDGEEVHRLPLPQELVNTGRRGALGELATLLGPDGDRDGKVTREELSEYYRKNGANPLQIGSGGGDQEMRIRRVALDTGRVPTQSGAEAMNKALLAALDSDKDGKFSRKELEEALLLLRKKDFDDDEMVTVAEVLDQSGADVGYQIVVDRMMAQPLPADSPLVRIDGRAPNRALAEALLKRYARGEEAAKAGKLSAKDVSLDAESFGQLDADGDGSLDREELSRFGRRAPDAEVIISLGKDAGIEVRAAPGRGDSVRVVKEKDGLSGLAIANTLLSFAVEGQPTGGIRTTVVNDDQFYKMQFTNADQDGNGYLDMNESNRGIFAGNFRAMDADNDGKLYLKEVTAYLERQKDLRDRIKNASATLTLADQGRGLFDMLDASGDGRLSVRELRQAMRLLDGLDADRDGSIAPSEVPRRFRLGAQPGVAGGGGPTRAIAFALGGRPAAPLPELKDGPLWFRKTDRNRDGDVSRREFLGTAEQFRAIDADGDGLIDAKEAEAFDRAQRKQ